TFHPRCTLEGYYKAEQCHDNFCWCVDKYGREFDNSRVIGRNNDGDGNNDGELSIKELIPLETDLNEKCLKAYIDRCGL
ncbi:hypothetical protein WUBG_17124, partial [Wuchereria bancrofti]